MRLDFRSTTAGAMHAATRTEPRATKQTLRIAAINYSVRHRRPSLVAKSSAARGPALPDG